MKHYAAIIFTIVLVACGSQNQGSSIATPPAASPALAQSAPQSCPLLLSPITHNNVGPATHWECTSNCGAFAYNDLMFSYQSFTGTVDAWIQMGVKTGNSTAQIQSVYAGSSFSFTDNANAGLIDGRESVNGTLYDLTFSQDCNQITVNGAIFTYIETIGS